MALAGRDVHGLVPAPRPARALVRLVDEDGRVHRRSFGSGLLEPGWTGGRGRRSSRFGVSLDHLRRPVPDRPSSTCSALPAILEKTLILFAWLGHRRRCSRFAVARTVGLGAIGAGLLPIAVGYLIAHYLTYLLIDGQRIVDRDLRPAPAGLGPVRHGVLRSRAATWLPPGLVWTIQLAAVVGGHMLGAWGGHVVAVGGRAARDRAPARCAGGRSRWRS